MKNRQMDKHVELQYPWNTSIYLGDVSKLTIGKTQQIRYYNFRVYLGIHNDILDYQVFHREVYKHLILSEYYAVFMVLVYKDDESVITHKSILSKQILVYTIPGLTDNGLCRLFNEDLKNGIIKSLETYNGSETLGIVVDFFHIPKYMKDKLSRRFGYDIKQRTEKTRFFVREEQSLVHNPDH